ncbi:uncharacterized protein MYCFIDRAFT_180378 [Pseudocercospora fijiensis CIRAD86]|uniref:Ubiquitin-like protease family profile domain-containing protein n=1 Tax=Pseudocercospora fijiensis (strain CIRAD86) TaxID=383855 RepID=M2YGV3_PSEFD|nr:uncharacterized protein MYCFIDRAFT_180378 [Pseudocercospora fijiensis CIRAD86]EME77045.1 hypothetical protein MYCFIDRAFT_180378 [Pseudocercospora fijiensis CIRAD86]
MVRLRSPALSRASTPTEGPLVQAETAPTRSNNNENNNENNNDAPKKLIATSCNSGSSSGGDSNNRSASLDIPHTGSLAPRLASLCEKLHVQWQSQTPLLDTFYDLYDAFAAEDGQIPFGRVRQHISPDLAAFLQMTAENELRERDAKLLSIVHSLTSQPDKRNKKDPRCCWNMDFLDLLGLFHVGVNGLSRTLVSGLSSAEKAGWAMQDYLPALARAANERQTTSVSARKQRYEHNRPPPASYKTGDHERAVSLLLEAGKVTSLHIDGGAQQGATSKCTDAEDQMMESSQAAVEQEAAGGHDGPKGPHGDQDLPGGQDGKAAQVPPPRERTREGIRDLSTILEDENEHSGVTTVPIEKEDHASLAVDEAEAESIVPATNAQEGGSIPGDLDAEYEFGYVNDNDSDSGGSMQEGSRSGDDSRESIEQPRGDVNDEFIHGDGDSSIQHDDIAEDGTISEDPSESVEQVRDRNPLATTRCKRRFHSFAGSPEPCKRTRRDFPQPQPATSDSWRTSVDGTAHTSPSNFIAEPRPLLDIDFTQPDAESSHFQLEPPLQLSSPSPSPDPSKTTRTPSLLPRSGDVVPSAQESLLPPTPASYDQPAMTLQSRTSHSPAAADAHSTEKRSKTEETEEKQNKLGTEHRPAVDWNFDTKTPSALPVSRPPLRASNRDAAPTADQALARVESGQWLNSTAVDKLLSALIPSRFHVADSSAATVTRDRPYRPLRDYPPDQMPNIILPLCDNHHWVIATIYSNTWTCIVSDSLRQTHRHKGFEARIRQFSQQLPADSQGRELTITWASDAPVQNDDVNCGILAIADVVFRAAEVSHQRQLDSSLLRLLFGVALRASGPDTRNVSNQDDWDLNLPSHLTRPTCPPAPKPTEGLGALETLMHIRAESTRLAEQYRDALRTLMQCIGQAKATCDALELALHRNIAEADAIDIAESTFAQCQDLDKELNSRLSSHRLRLPPGSLASLQALRNANITAMEALRADTEKHRIQVVVWRRTLAATSSAGKKLIDTKEEIIVTSLAYCCCLQHEPFGPGYSHFQLLRLRTLLAPPFHTSTNDASTVYIVAVRFLVPLLRPPQPLILMLRLRNRIPHLPVMSAHRVLLQPCACACIWPIIAIAISSGTRGSSARLFPSRARSPIKDAATLESADIPIFQCFRRYTTIPDCVGPLLKGLRRVAEDELPWPKDVTEDMEAFVEDLTATIDRNATEDPAPSDWHE